MADIYLSEWSLPRIMQIGHPISGGIFYCQVRNGSRSYFRRPKNSEFKPQYTTRTIKHVRRSVMVWVRFSYYGVGPIHWIKAIMDQHVYVDIMDTIMLPFAEYEMTPNIPARRQRKGLGTTLWTICSGLRSLQTLIQLRIYGRTSRRQSLHQNQHPSDPFGE